MIKIHNSIKLIIVYQLLNLILIFSFRTYNLFKEIVVYNPSPTFGKFADLSLIFVVFILIFLIIKKNFGYLFLGVFASFNNITEFIFFRNVVDYINVFNIGTINISDIMIYISTIILIKKILTRS